MKHYANVMKKAAKNRITPNWANYQFCSLFHLWNFNINLDHVSVCIYLTEINFYGSSF